MKNNDSSLARTQAYRKILFFLGILFFFGNTVLAQIQLTTDPPIQVDWDICKYHPDPNPVKRTISIPEKVRQKMLGGDTPCTTFDVTYTGFTTEAEAAFQYAVDIWSYLIETPVTIKINAQFSALGPGVLGNANAAGYYALSGGSIPPNTVFAAALADKLVGFDINSSGPDINANFSNSFPFYFGLDGNPPGSQYDFVSVVLHELGHGLGFAGLGRVDDDDSPTQGLLRNSGYVSIWDQYIQNGAGTSILDFDDPSAALLAEYTSNDLECNSPAAAAENGAVNPRTYAPSTWSGGSSYSHWNESTYGPGNINSLMTPQIGSGEAIHDPGPVALGFMEDMGWDLCTPTLEVNEVSLGEFIYYPNPIENTVHFKAQNNIQKITMFNMLGQVIISETPNSLERDMDVSQLRAGTYFVNVSVGNSVKIIKLIKN